MVGILLRPLASPRIALAGMLALCVGCAHVPKTSESMKRAGLETSTSELRSRAVELGRGTLGGIERAADSIDARTTDPRIRRNTLLMRLSSVTAVTEAVLREDPGVAMLDLYACHSQIAAFLASPAGTADFGDDVTILERAIARGAQRWEQQAGAADYQMNDTTRVQLAAWVQEHPIDGLPFTRPSLVGALSTLASAESGIGAAVGGIEASIDRLELRIGLANEYAIKQGTWLSRLAAMEVSASPEAAELRSTLGSTRSLVEDAPQLVRNERAVVLGDVDRQRRESFAILAEERAILLRAVAEERAILLAAVDEQRRLAMRDVDSLRVRLIADEIRVVDHLVWRLAQLSAALMVLGLVGVLLLRRRGAPAS